MNDLQYLLKLVRIQKNISVDVQVQCPKGSPSYHETRGAIGAYDTIETYINNMILEKVKET